MHRLLQVPGDAFTVPDDKPQLILRPRMPCLGRCAKPANSLGLVVRLIGVLSAHLAKRHRRWAMSVDRGPSIPTGSRGQITMGLVEIAEAFACVQASLFGRAHQPALAFSLVALRDAPALQVHQPEIVLGLAVALLGGRSIPADGHAVVLGHAALAVVVETAQAVLRLGMPLLG